MTKMFFFLVSNFATGELFAARVRKGTFKKMYDIDVSARLIVRHAVAVSGCEGTVFLVAAAEVASLFCQRVTWFASDRGSRVGKVAARRRVEARVHELLKQKTKKG